MTFTTLEGLRAHRNTLLAETDYLMLKDQSLTLASELAFSLYRQELRDITEGVTDANVADVVLPTKPVPEYE